MIRLFKWLALIVAVLAVLALGSLTVAVLTVDPNDFKPQITAQVKKATGRELTLAGDIGWSFYPWLGLNLGKASLANPPGFGDQPFARIDEIDIKVKLLPLLRKQLQARQIVISGVSLDLQKDRQGRDNWSDLAKGAGESAKAPEKAAEGGVPSGLKIRVNGLKLRNLKLRYRDRQAGTDIRIDPLNLTTGAIELGKPVRFEGGLALEMTGLAVKLPLSGQLTADLEHNRYRLDDFELTPTITGDGLPANGLTGAIQLDLAADLNAQTLKASTLRLALDDLTLEGQLAVDRLIDNPAFSGHFASNEFNPGALMTALGVEAPKLADNAALQRAALAFDLKGDAKRLSLENLSATLDDSTLRGRFALTDLARMAMAFDLELDAIDIDRYLPASTETAAAQASTPATASDTLPLPIDMLRKLRIDGVARVGKLTASKLQFQNASVTVKADHGALRIAPLRAEAYQGKAVIDAQLDVRGDTPLWKASIDLAGVRSEDILQTLFGDRYLSGEAAFKARIDTRSDSIEGLQRNLGGNFSVSFKDGTIKGSKLSKKINEARNFWRKLQGKPPVTDDIGENTHFSSLTATGRITHGVIENHDLKILAPIFQAKGEGRIDLPRKFIDYSLSLADEGPEDAGRTFVPLQIKGPFDNLHFKLRLDSVLKARANAKLEAEKARLKAKADAEKARLKARLESEKAAKKAELEAKAAEKKAELKKKAEEKKQELKKKLEDKLKDELKGLF